MRPYSPLTYPLPPLTVYYHASFLRRFILTLYITRHWGIRQGDPVYPLLFNIAFDTFLRSIQQNLTFKGFDLPVEAPFHSEDDDLADALKNLFLQSIPTSNTIDSVVVTLQDITLNPTAPPDLGQVKVLADADDSLVYLKDTNYLYQLQQAIHTYIKASNSILNYRKTTAISLSGKLMLDWQALLGFHSSPNGMIVLPLLHSFISATQFVLVLLSAISPFKNFTILSVIPLVFIPNVMYPRGRVTILNSLICSKLGHVLRLSVFTKAQLLSSSLGTFFINARIFPRFFFDALI